MAQHWRDAAFAAIDFEGTDQNPWRAHPCEVAVVPVDEGRVRPDAAFSTLIRPRRRIPAESSKIHGITNNMVQRVRGFPRIRGTLRRLLEGRVLIAYDAAYDLVLLERYMFQERYPLVVDAKLLAQQLAGSGHCSLASLVGRFKLHERITAASSAGRAARPHQALYDAYAAAHLCIALLDRYLPAASLSAVLAHGGYAHPYRARTAALRA